MEKQKCGGPAGCWRALFSDERKRQDREKGR